MAFIAQLGKSMDITAAHPDQVQETGIMETGGAERAPQDHESLIQRLQDEIARLRGDTGNQAPPMPADMSMPVPGTREPVPGTRTEMPRAQQEAPQAQTFTEPAAPQKGTTTPPLLEGVDHPTLESGAPDMREPGPHQNPVSYAHLSNGDVVKVAGAIPTFIHTVEGELVKVISAHPMYMENGMQMLAGLLRTL